MILSVLPETHHSILMEYHETLHYCQQDNPPSQHCLHGLEKEKENKLEIIEANNCLYI